MAEAARRLESVAIRHGRRVKLICVGNTGQAILLGNNVGIILHGSWGYCLDQVNTVAPGNTELQVTYLARDEMSSQRILYHAGWSYPVGAEDCL